MAVVKNTFSTVLENVSFNTHTLNGLISETSTYNVNTMSPEISLHFLRSVYQTLIDAGYTDAVINETEYSVTVLGFKFFVLCKKPNSSSYDVSPCIYTYATSTANTTSQLNRENSSSDGTFGLNIYNDLPKLEYNITVRGDENCIHLYYGSYKFPNYEYPLIFIAKSKNLITSEEAYYYCSAITDTSSSYYFTSSHFRNKKDLFHSISISSNIMNYCYNDYGLNTQSKMVCEPLLGYYGTYYIHSMLKCNNSFEQGKYYKIGSDIYYCNSYSSSSIGTSPAKVLFKVS